MSRARKLKLIPWLAAQGAEILPLCDYELARFRAQDTLCIVYERNRKGKQSFVPELAREAFEAWQAGTALDLRNAPPEARAPSHRETADIVCNLVTRIRAGETIDIAVTAEGTGFDAGRIERIGSAWGFTVADGTITRVAA